jgi:hypothetical protein
VSEASEQGLKEQQKMKVKMIIFAKAREGFDFSKMSHFSVHSCLILKSILEKLD